MQATWRLSDLDSARLIPPESDMTRLFLLAALILEAPDYWKLITSIHKIPLRTARHVLYHDSKFALRTQHTFFYLGRWLSSGILNHIGW
jgi:hypothetical protein